VAVAQGPVNGGLIFRLFVSSFYCKKGRKNSPELASL